MKRNILLLTVFSFLAFVIAVIMMSHALARLRDGNGDEGEQEPAIGFTANVEKPSPFCKSDVADSMIGLAGYFSNLRAHISSEKL